MAKKKIDNEIFETLIEDYNIKDTNDIKDMLKDLLSGTIQTMINSWRSNWNELTTYFKYNTKIRNLIYTTNPIESLNRQLRKYTKTKSLYPTDETLMKSVYLSLKEATKKWTGRIPGWGEIYSQLSIYFEGRI